MHQQNKNYEEENNLFVSICVAAILANERQLYGQYFFSTSKHQEEIIVEPLLLNNDDVIHLLSGDLKEEINHSHSSHGGINLVVRLKNLSNKGAWGTLLCTVPGYGDVRIYIPHLTPNMKEFVTFVIPLSGMVAPRSIGKPPVLEIMWEKLSIK